MVFEKINIHCSEICIVFLDLICKMSSYKDETFESKKCTFKIKKIIFAYICYNITVCSESW